MNEILFGVDNCSALVAPKGYLLVKVQDQVANGRMYWQADRVSETLKVRGFDKEAVFHFRHRPRPQRSQVRARNNYSTMLVFKR